MPLTYPILLLSLSLTTLLTCTLSDPQPNTPSPYISPKTFLPNYQAMLNNFKIFIYEPNTALSPPPQASPTESLFHGALRRSRFATEDAEQAHLFLVPSSSAASAAAIARVLRAIRRDFPYWNRTLGADHAFVSCAGLAAAGLGGRNVLELKKNAIQISCFPTAAENFVPHKDVTLPPASSLHAPPEASERPVLGYLRHRNGSVLADRLGGDPDFVVETEPVDEAIYADRLASSKFCIFEHDGHHGAGRIGEALRYGCVPAVLVAEDSPVLIDLPFSNVLAWQEMAVLVRGRAEELKRALRGAIVGGGERYEKMRAVGLAASKHLVWLRHEDDSGEPYGCFNMVMYQLWLRRHSIRYVTRSS